MMNPSTKLEVTQEGETIEKKAKNGNPSGVWMKVKWGRVFWISELEKSEKHEEDERKKSMNRIGFYCHVTYLDIADVISYSSFSHSKNSITHQELQT